MAAKVGIIEERGSLRLIRCEELGYAVVETRAGRVYSTDGHHEAEAPDTQAGMATVAGKTGWMNESDARRRFDSLVENGRRLARTMW